MCDNSAVVDAINKKSMRGETIAILQLILLVAAIQDIELHAEWLPSEDNAIADALSRHQYEKLTVLCKQLGICPTLLRNSTHLRGYRKKLLSSYGMDLHPLQENHTSQPSTATKLSSHSNDPELCTRHRSKRSQHGLQQRLSKPKRKQRRSTSLVTPYGEVQQYQQLSQAFPEMKSKSWGGGK